MPEASGFRSRFGRIGGPRSAIPELDPLLRTLRGFHQKADTKAIERAYEVAAHLHRDQRRRSGEPYITHPLAVAGILADLGMDTPILAAALLHDTVEDTGYSLDALREDFGDEIAALVDGVTKLDQAYSGEDSRSDTIRKLIKATGRDLRVLLIKLADRLHNMRTIRWMSPEKQQQKARETLEIYAPMAHRMGLNTVKVELEDLAFATLHPKIYEEIVRLVTQRAPARDQYMAQVIAEIEADLRRNKIRAKVTGRPKHYYSIYQKMVHRGRDFDEIYDLVGVRVLVDDPDSCYAVLGAIHGRWTPVPGRIKDYIKAPKYANYRSLHTTVFDSEGKLIEVQIRSHEMHRQAEFGVASHWRYKERTYGGTFRPDDFRWLQQLLDLHGEADDASEFMDQLRFDLGGSEVFVFTPKGDMVALARGATPVDFAYSVHTEVGHRCVGARVNGKLVPLESQLSNGDVIEIFTSKAEGAGPSRDWLAFVASARAKSKIRAWFSRERRDEAIEHGKEAIIRAMRRQSLPLQRLMTNQALQSIALDLHHVDVSSLYASVGEGRISASAVVQRLLSAIGSADEASEDVAAGIAPSALRTRPSRSSADVGIEVVGANDVLVKLAKCCTPVPGDVVIGFVTRGSGVSVHRDDCVNAIELKAEPERLVQVRWAPTASSIFLVNLQVKALDRAGLLSDVTRALSDMHVNILSASVTTTRERIALSRFTFEMADAKHLGSVIKSVRGVEGVFDAYRV